MFSQKSKWFKSLSFLGLFTLSAALIWVGWSNFANTQTGKTAKAAFNSNYNRFENTLDPINNTAKYSYVVENTSPDAANGYFELKMQALLSQTNIGNIVDVTSIRQTFPVNNTTGEPTTNSPTIINEIVSDSSFIDGDFLNIKISPGTQCVHLTTGGCEMKLIPAAVPMRIDIELKLKPNVANNFILDGQGKVFFPNGFDTNQIGWRITVNAENPLPPQPAVTITQANLVENGLSVTFTTNNYANTPGGVHTHFYFDTEANTVVNKMYSGASPYSIPLTSIPQNATKICAIVANPDHSIIAESGNCVNLPNSGSGDGGGSTNTGIIPAPNSKIVAGVPQNFLFTLRNNSNSSSDIYAAIGLADQLTWSQAKSTVLKPTPLCTISVPDGFVSSGTCEDLFNARGFKINNLAAGGSVQVKVSKVIFVAPPVDTNNEINFRIFSSNLNSFGAGSTPNYETVTYNSSYGNNLEINMEKVSSADSFGGIDAFNQIQAPYNDLIYAVTIKNTAQIAYNGVGIDNTLDSNSTNYYDGCSFSQVQNLPVAQLGQVIINVVNPNLQGTSYTGVNTNYILTNISIPPSNGYEPSKSVFYVGCKRNSFAIPSDSKLFALASITNFDHSLDSTFDLVGEGGIKSKLQISSGNNLKIEKSLISKSTSKIQAGTEVEYEVKVMNIGPAVANDFLISDIIQIPSGMGINVALSGGNNPFQDGSTSLRVVDIQDIITAFPVTNNQLGNTSRVFKVSKLKGNDYFSFRYKITFSGTFPTSCSVSSFADNFPVIRNIAFVANLNSGIANGDIVSGTTNNLSVGSIIDFLKFNTNLENNSLNVSSNVLFNDTDLSDNLAIVDNTKDICDFSDINPPISGTVLTTNEISNLNVVCLPVLAGTKTTCSFKLAKDITLPPDFKIGVGDALPMAGCERVDYNPEDQTITNAILSEVVVCKDVQSPPAGQSVLLFGQIGNEARTLTGEKLILITDSNLPLTLTPSDNKVDISWASVNGQIIIGIPEVSISLNEGDDLTSFEPASIQVTDFRTISITNLVPCSSYKLKFSLTDIAGNIISSNIKEFKTTGCVDNKVIKAEKTVPVSSTSGGKLKLIDGSDSLDLNIPAGFSNSDKKIQAKKLDQTASQINGLPKLPNSKRLAKGKTFDLKAFDSTNSITTTFQQPISVTMSYTDQDVSLLDPNSLTIKSWNGTVWQDLTNCSKDTVNKKVSCDTTHFSVFSLAGQTALDTYDLSWSFSPSSGTSAPLFKDSTPVVATVKNFSSSRNNAPSAGEYTCKFEFKPIKASTSTYTQINTGVTYDPVSGCSANLTKALRANNLNIEFKVTITSVSNPNQSYTSTHRYFMLFRGSGVAFGN